MTEYEKYCLRHRQPTTDELYPPELYPEDLQPCPFCGNICERITPDGKINLQPVRIETTRPGAIEKFCKNGPEKYYYVQCFKCFARSGNSPTIQSAVKRWNTRA